MEDETKKALIFGALSGITGCALYYFQKQYQELLKKKDVIKSQENVYGTGSLIKHRQSFEAEPKFAMVEGVCVRHKTRQL
jgi:hypothetical protein